LHSARASLGRARGDDSASHLYSATEGDDACPAEPPAGSSRRGGEETLHRNVRTKLYRGFGWGRALSAKTSAVRPVTARPSRIIAG
jgi:hypothetical protein